MIPNLKPYPAYQDSSVPWLGRIPAHWQQSPGRACFIEKKTPNVGMQETTVLSLSYGQIVVKPPEKLHGLVPASFETYQIIEPYDIVIRPTDLQNDWVSLRTGLAKTRGIITSAYMRLRTKDSLAPEYGRLLLHAYDLKKVFYGLGSGLRQNLSWHDFKYLPCLVPPPDEQTAIVRFLDYIDRRTRRYIRAQRKLIALLEEQKQAIIQRAVTRGLDPETPLKDSGIEWLGDIPEHWGVIKLKHLLTEPLKYGANEAAEQSDRSMPRYIRITDIDKGGRLIDDTFRSIDEKIAEPYLLQDGDILLARSGATVGKAFLYCESYGKAAHAGYLIRARVDRQLIHPQYLHTFLLSPAYWNWVASIIIQATIQNVSAEKYNNLVVALPPLSEQGDLVRTIANCTQTLGAAIADVQRQIDLIREYRTRLIADVVTGKLDVRQAAASLPEEAKEPQEWDVDEAEGESDEDLDEAGVEANDEDD